MILLGSSLALAIFAAIANLALAVPSHDLGYAPYARASRQGIRGADAVHAVSVNPGQYASKYLGYPGRAGK